MVLLQADEPSCGIGFGAGRKAYGLRCVVEGVVQIAEIGKGPAPEQIWGGIQRVGFDSSIQKRYGLCRFKAFAAFCPVFFRFLKQFPCFRGNASFHSGIDFFSLYALPDEGLFTAEKGKGKGKPGTAGKKAGEDEKRGSAEKELHAFSSSREDGIENRI
jgi:hypothetical protein